MHLLACAWCSVSQGLSQGGQESGCGQECAHPLASHQHPDTEVGASDGIKWVGPTSWYPHPLSLSPHSGVTPRLSRDDGAEKGGVVMSEQLAEV